MSTLHIVSTSPFDSNALLSALKTASQDDAILLIQNGVYAAIEAPHNNVMMALAPSGLRMYALAEDVDARALPVLTQHITKISYSDFVTLVCEHHNSVSWN